MRSKLTLTIDEKVVLMAKEYAKEKGRSLSDLVEIYLKLLTNERPLIKSKDLSPRIRRLRGIIKTGADLDHK